MLDDGGSPNALEGSSFTLGRLLVAFTVLPVLPDLWITFCRFLPMNLYLSSVGMSDAPVIVYLYSAAKQSRLFHGCRMMILFQSNTAMHCRKSSVPSPGAATQTQSVL